MRSMGGICSSRSCLLRRSWHGLRRTPCQSDWKHCKFRQRHKKNKNQRENAHLGYPEVLPIGYLIRTLIRTSSLLAGPTICRPWPDSSRLKALTTSSDQSPVCPDCSSPTARVANSIGRAHV